MMMKFETFTVPVIRIPAGDGIAPLGLVEAMSAVAASRSTRKVIKAYKAAGVTGTLIIPFVADCPVDPGTLGRAMRRAWKAALAGTERGDLIRIELQPKRDLEVVDIIASHAEGARPEKPAE